MVGMDRAAAHAAFSELLSDRSLTEQQIRFIEMMIDQLTARGVMDAKALFEQPFTSLHAGGPDGVFADNPRVLEGIFQTLKHMESALPAAVA
jgi:type I restriction enzyme R subunit